MRRVAAGAAFTAVGVLAVYALAPRLHARLLAACERMFEEMPESFPPKRIMRRLDEIGVNSARTLQLLEQRELLETASTSKGRSRLPAGAP